MLHYSFGQIYVTVSESTKTTIKIELVKKTSLVADKYDTYIDTSQMQIMGEYTSS